jgi:hypothetical protein
VNLRTNMFLSSVTILTLTFGSFAMAEQSAAKASKPAKKEEKKSFAVSKTGIGPETDNLRPLTKAEEKSLAAQIQETLKNYPEYAVTKRADGTSVKVVAPHFLDFTVVRKGPDGKLVFGCSQDVQKLENAKIERLPEE